MLIYLLVSMVIRGLCSLPEGCHLAYLPSMLPVCFCIREIQHAFQIEQRLTFWLLEGCCMRRELIPWSSLSNSFLLQKTYFRVFLGNNCSQISVIKFLRTFKMQVEEEKWVCFSLAGRFIKQLLLGIRSSRIYIPLNIWLIALKVELQN